MPDGTPVRARLTVSLSEYRNVELEAKEIKRQTVDYTKVHVVTEGDTLALIAVQRVRRRHAPGVRSRSATASPTRAR